MLMVCVWYPEWVCRAYLFIDILLQSYAMNMFTQTCADLFSFINYLFWILCSNSLLNVIDEDGDGGVNEGTVDRGRGEKRTINVLALEPRLKASVATDEPGKTPDLPKKERSW